MARRWSPAEDAELVLSYRQGTPFKIIVRRMGRSFNSINWRLGVLGIRNTRPRNNYHPLSEHELRQLKELLELGEKQYLIREKMRIGLQRLKRGMLALGCQPKKPARSPITAEQALALRAAGLGQWRIAKQLNVTIGVVAGVLHRERKRMEARA